MALIYKPRQLSDEQGRPTGRWRMTVHSDEERWPPRPICDCDEGHESPDAARSCPEVRSRIELEFPGAPAPTIDGSVLARRILERASVKTGWMGNSKLEFASVLLDPDTLDQLREIARRP